jgi:cell division protease FtsH
MTNFWQRWRVHILVLLIAVAVAALVVVQGRFSRRTDVQLSEIARAVKAQEVDKLVVTYDSIQVFFKDKTEATSRKERSATLNEQLRDFGVTTEQLSAVKIEIVEPTNWNDLLATISLIATPIIVVFFFWFILRQAQGANNSAFSFGRSRARVRGLNGERPTITFSDVAGADEAKQELVEVVEFLKEPEKFVSLGARIPKGVLLIGSPGTGKTLLAKAVSGEAGVPFFSISGSEFVEMFVGVGASRVRDLFDNARRHSPCIIFVDEIDAVGRSRGAGVGGGHDEREQTLNQILVEMDGFDTDTNIIIIAATNRPDILDPALMRPGRFDRRVVLDRPDLKGREAILRVHAAGKPLAVDVELHAIAKATPGFVGADLENLVNEAAILAARRNRRTVSMSEFNESIERVMMGPERKSRIISEKEKRITAFHEAGHAIVAHLLPNCDPIHKVTIIPRGMAMGYAWSLPNEDRYMKSRMQFVDELSHMLGGRAAEEIVFGDITTGASNDLQRVTETARDMVTRYGMSDAMGPMVYGQKQEMIFLGRDLGEQRDYSEAVALEIDREVQGLVQTAYTKAKTLLSENRIVLDKVSQRLIEVETIEANEFKRFFDPNAVATHPDGAAPNLPPSRPKPAPSTGGSDKNDLPRTGGLPSPMPA